MMIIELFFRSVKRLVLYNILTTSRLSPNPDNQMIFNSFRHLESILSTKIDSYSMLFVFLKNTLFSPWSFWRQQIYGFIPINVTRVVFKYNTIFTECDITRSCSNTNCRRNDLHSQCETAKLISNTINELCLRYVKRLVLLSILTTYRFSPNPQIRWWLTPFRLILYALVAHLKNI